MTPTFSVIIPAKNEAASLPSLLQEIRSQTLQPVEVIVADAGSTDDTVALALAAGAKVVPGGMPSVGRNAGAEGAVGEILWFLDADVYLGRSDFFAVMLKEFVARQLEVAGARVRVVDAGWIDQAMHIGFNWYAAALWRIARFPHAGGCCILARATVFRDVQGFDEQLRFCEDHDFVRRAAQRYAFGILRSAAIGLDTRRQEMDGRWKLVKTYVLAEYELWRRGTLHHSRLDYNLDYERPERRRVQ